MTTSTPKVELIPDDADTAQLRKDLLPLVEAAINKPQQPVVAPEWHYK